MPGSRFSRSRSVILLTMARTRSMSKPSKGQGPGGDLEKPAEIEEGASSMKYGMCSGLSLQVPRLETWVAGLRTVLTLS